MDIARAMYLGGTTIRASEGNYSSYDKKGLLCCFCGEPVYLKKGDIRKPHFAHFPGTDPKQVEECELRASSYGNSSQLNSFIKDRGQRLKIFQQHFLNLISFEGDKPTTNLDFNNWINSIKRDHSTVIDIIVNDCTDYFIRNCHQIAAKYIKQITNNDNKPILIQQEIALEAISYLCVKSSCKLIKYLLHYGIYKLFKHEISNLFKDEVKTQNVDNICHLVIKIIVLNIWTEALNEVESNNIKIQSQTKLSSQLYELSNASQFCVSYTVMGGKKGNVPIVYTLEAINGKLLIYFHSTVAVKNEVTGKTDNVHNKLEVGEIKAVPGSFYIDLKQDLLPNKLIFDDYNFHCELLVNYALPDWISRSADLVESNKIAPVWLIVSKLIILTCYDEITNELSINETNTVKTFNIVQWWEILLDCAKECPTVLQFQNAAKLNQQMAVITKQTSTGKTDIYFFLSSIDGSLIKLRNDKKEILNLHIDLRQGLSYVTPSMKDGSPNVDLINLISDISKNTDKLDTSLGLDWLVVAFKVYQVVIMRRVDAVSTEIVNATIKDWIAAIKSVKDINKAIVITDFLLNKSFMGSRLNSSEKTSLNQVLTKLKNSLQSEQSQNKLKHTVDAVNVTNITNNTTQKLTKENRNKWRKPSYVKSLLQRLKDNPPVRSNQFQGVDYFVSKCVISIPENNTKLADKIRQFLSFEVEKISVNIPENIRQDYDGKMKTTIRYDCDDQVLLNLVTEQYTNNERSIWNVKHNPDNYSIDVSLKLNVSKLSFKQLNIMYKKANKYYESISHDTIFSILDMLVLDKSELIKISRTPLIIAFNILLSLDPVIDYYQFIKQIRVDTVNGDLMSCISLPTIDVKTSRIIMIPDLNLFNESLNTSWNYADCREHKDIQSVTLARSTGTKVVKNNILSNRYKSDNKQVDTDFTEHSTRTYLSNMFLSICSDNYDLVGSRLLFELVSKGQNQYGDPSIAYLQTTTYESYEDRKNGIRHTTDRVTTEVNKALLDFCKLHGIRQNKVLGRIALQTNRHLIEYVGLLYINKHGYLSYKSFDANKTNNHPEVKQYLSLHGLRDDRFVSPSRISVNWKQILNLDVVPKSKQGNISYEFTDNYPYTVI